ncbi:MAG: thioesterase family protein [Stellaceae bacterium]
MSENDAPGAPPPLGIEAPFARYRGEVLPQWIDLNGHLNFAYYSVLFDEAADLLFEAIGIGAGYKRATGHGTFIVETHNRYEHELLAGERVRIVSQILGADTKRLHLAHEMFRLGDERRVATQELMFLSIDLARRRVVPFLASAQRRVDAAAAAHAVLVPPDWAGRKVAMRVGARPTGHGGA